MGVLRATRLLPLTGGPGEAHRLLAEHEAKSENAPAEDRVASELVQSESSVARSADARGSSSGRFQHGLDLCTGRLH